MRTRQIVISASPPSIPPVSGPPARFRFALLCTLLLLLALCRTSAALAEPVVTVYTNGRGGFTIMANNVNRVIEAEVRVDYLSDDQTPPRVSGAGLGAQATIEVQADNPGSFTLRLKSGKPMSGYVQFATAQILGTVTSLSAWLRNDSGTTETPSVEITNPTDEQLSAMAARRPASMPSAAPRPAGIPLPELSPAASPVPRGARVDAARPPKPDSSSRGIAFSHRKSVLELFRTYSGERTPAALARLFERGDDMFLQEPPVLLSDGTAALRLTVRESVRDERGPMFFISGGSCIGLKNDDGTWMLEIVPERGSLETSVTLLSGGEKIMFPLAVAPPLEQFDMTGAGEGEAEYVAIANRLATGLHLAE